MKRIGIFGGTFDPVHLGHLRSASYIKTHFQLDEMRLMPLSTPAHKALPTASKTQRLECLQLAVQAYSDLSIDGTELDRQGYSYTVDTLYTLRDSEPDNIFYWVMGMDAFAGFENWKKPDDILALSNLIVVDRPGYPDEQNNTHAYQQSICTESELLEKTAGGITFVKIPPIDITSTALREKLRHKPYEKTLTEYIPIAVLNYIEENNIYAKEVQTMKVEEVKDKIIDALEDIKGIDITVLSVSEMTSVADYLIVASGKSDRQVKSLANNVQMKLKEHDVRPLGVEGEREGQWVLIDYADILVHIMLPDVRDFYNLEKLWEQRPATAQQL